MLCAKLMNWTPDVAQHEVAERLTRAFQGARAGDEDNGGGARQAGEQAEGDVSESDVGQEASEVVVQEVPEDDADADDEDRHLQRQPPRAEHGPPVAILHVLDREIAPAPPASETLSDVADGRLELHAVRPRRAARNPTRCCAISRPSVRPYRGGWATQREARPGAPRQEPACRIVRPARRPPRGGDLAGAQRLRRVRRLLSSSPPRAPAAACRRLPERRPSLARRPPRRARRPRPAAAGRLPAAFASRPRHR